MNRSVARLGISLAFLAGSLLYLRANWPYHDAPADWKGEGYTITKLVYLGNQHVFSLVALNDEGQIVGAGPSSTGRFCAQFYDGRIAHDLGALPGYDGSRAYGLNNRGVVAGSSYISKGSYSLRPTKACYWDGSGIHALPTLAGFPCSRAWAIDDRGDIVGHSYKPESEEKNAASQPTLWRNGVAIPLPLPEGAMQGEAHAIGGDAIVGTVAMKDGKSRACLWRAGKPLILAPLAGHESSEAVGATPNGDVVGVSDGIVTIWHSETAAQAFDPPGAVRLRPVGMNDAGVIAFNALGIIVDKESNDVTLPFVYFPDRGCVRVSHLVPAHIGYDFAKVLAINAKGQLAVGARYKGESASIYLLSPPGVR